VGYEWPRDITQTFSVNDDVEFRHDRIRQISSWHLELSLGYSQNHLAVAGGCAAFVYQRAYGVPTRYRELVLTVSKHVS